MESSSPLVSVIITTYKRPDFLRRSLLSVLNQSYSNLQIIIVNDDPSIAYPTQKGGFWCDHRIQYINHSFNMGAPRYVIVA